MSKFERNLDKKKEDKYENCIKKALKLIELNLFARARKILLKCYKFYQKTNDSRKLFDISMSLLDLSKREGKNQESINIINKIFNKYKEFVDNIYEGKLYNDLGDSYYDLREIQKSRENYNKAKIKFEAAGIYQGVISVISNIANTFLFEGHIEKALEIFINAKDLCFYYNYFEYLHTITGNIFTVYLQLKDFQNAELFYIKTKELLESREGYYELIILMNNLAAYYGEFGDFDKPKRILMDCLNLAQKHHFKDLEISMNINLCFALTNLNQMDEAKQYLLEIEKLHKETEKDLHVQGEILHLKGLIHYNEGKIAEAVENTTKSLEFVKIDNNYQFIIKNYKLLGDIYKKNGDLHNSYINYSQLLEFYRKISDEIRETELKEKYSKNFEYLPQLLESLYDIIKSADFTPDLEGLINLGENSTEACKKASIFYKKEIRCKCYETNQRLHKIINKTLRDNYDKNIHIFYKGDIPKISSGYSECDFELNNQLDKLSFWEKNNPISPSGELWLDLCGVFFYFLNRSFINKQLLREEAQNWKNEPKDMSPWFSINFSRIYKEKFRDNTKVSDGDCDHWVEIIPIEDKLLKNSKKEEINEIIDELYEKHKNQIIRESGRCGYGILNIVDVRENVKNNTLYASPIPKVFKVYYENNCWIALFIFQAFTKTPSYA